MADKEHQTSSHPIIPQAANIHHHRSDTEAAATHDDGSRLSKKKRTKCLLYIFLFAIFQTAVILLFALATMKIRTPKLRLRSATVTGFAAGSPSNPSFSGSLTAEMGVRNANFGRYKYRDTAVVFSYRGTPVGQVLVPNSRAGWRSTKKFRVAVDLSMGGNGSPAVNSALAGDLAAGVLPVTCEARMRGRVELLFVMKKNRATSMNCSMEIVTATQQIRNIVCK